ncbi:hypothetical protein MBAV_001568 [Candidatus Magnetobacterium bavaricum]|uniref:Uncharacterized protein n=1 Tax=Candidatus Magnetobacterium bavaricum TaxID=29290 RepID=A0A0F3GW90_9BACT|nr:hypothetical protein MBAV_001568 [Candidatus Magnetobacterium bavaricum]
MQDVLEGLIRLSCPGIPFCTPQQRIVLQEHRGLKEQAQLSDGAIEILAVQGGLATLEVSVSARQRPRLPRRKQKKKKKKKRKKGAAPPPFRTPCKGAGPLDPIILNSKHVPASSQKYLQ